MDQIEFLNLFYPVSSDNYLLLKEKFVPKEFKKGEIIIRPGQIQKELFFVNSGIQMSYFESEAKDHVIAFTYPPNLCAIPQSFSFQQPSDYYLKCLTHSQMDAISSGELEKLFDESHELERLFRKMTEAVLTGVINRHVELHTLSIEERFKSFCKRSPQLLNSVPHKYLASYLNIDSTNFSKLFNNVRL